MTDEETKTVVVSKVKSHFAPKPPPPPKEKIPMKTVKHFVDFLEWQPGHVENRPSDYDRSIRKSYEQMQQSRRRSSNKSEKTVPQLEEQAMQLIPPLKVITDNVTDADREMAREMGITVEQFLGIEEVPTMDPKELAWKYVPGNPLVRPEEVPLLSPQMCRLHDWYLREI